MKKYKILIPVALVVLMALSIFSTLSNAASQKKEYDDALKQAREAVKLGIIEDATSNYKKAMEIKPSVDISIELGEAYVAQDWISEAASWGEEIINQFPEEGKGYAFLMEQYIELEDFEECFELIDLAQAKKIDNKNLEELYEKIEYVYEYEYDSFQDVSIFSSGYCAVMDDERWGYVDLEGKTVIKPQFLWAGVFTTDGIAPIESEGGEYYYISESGNKKVVVQNLEECIDLGPSSGNILCASDNGDYAYYNQKFEKLFDQTYAYATTMNGDRAAVQEIDKWYMIDDKGNKIGEEYDEIIVDEKGISYRNDRVFVRKSGQILMVDADGEQVGEKVFDDAKVFMQSDAYAAVKVGTKWGFADKTGKIVIEPQYTDASSFINGYAAVEHNGKWGFIDEKGKMIINCRFEDARDFNENGNVFVKESGMWKLLKLIKDHYK